MIHSYCNLRIVIVLLIIIVFDKINKLRLSHNSIHHFDTFQNNKIKVMRRKKSVPKCKLFGTVGCFLHESVPHSAIRPLY